MKERPILFSGSMVRAILAGTKTQTRRPVKLNPSGRAILGGRNWHLDDPECVLACPYGQPGVRLWVRETWAHHPCGGTLRLPPGEGHAWGNPIYLATFGAGIKPVCEGFTPWRPSIHMPRWACRLVLEIVSVRVERLEDITIADAQAEGFSGHGAIIPFIQTWSRMYQHRGFGCDAKPWVWVVEFKRAEASA